MTLHSRHADRPMRRHDLIFVSPTRWCSLIRSRADLAADPLVAFWVDNGWPLVRRRALPDEAHGVALGLPLPPSVGKGRLSILMRPEDIISTAPPPLLSFAGRAAPYTWLSTLERLDKFAAQHALQPRVFGSLAWRALTGLNYLTDRSDLDLLLHVRRGTDLRRLATEMSLIEADAPMRLDGEFVRDDGAAVNWREFCADTNEVLVKTVAGVALLGTSRFLSAEVRP